MQRHSRRRHKRPECLLSRSGHAKSHLSEAYKKIEPGLLVANEEKIGDKARRGNHLAFRGGFLIN
jgi:hypothetical protein